MSVYRVDLHVHTSASLDGRASLDKLADAAKKRGLDAIAITDHGLCTPCSKERNGVLLIPGCEISTKAGHITGLFIKQPVDFQTLGSLPEPEAAVAAIRAAGGLAVLAHPFQSPGTTNAKYPFDLDAVETANARAWMKVPDANNKAATFAQSRQLPQVGGSDAHDYMEVGNAYTLLEASQCTVDALWEALSGGKSEAVLSCNTRHIRKGLSQWTKAQRQGGILRLCRAIAYIFYCAILDLVYCNRSPAP